MSSLYGQYLSILYDKQDLDNFTREIIFKKEDWSIHGYSYKNELKEVFWGNHEPCDSPITGDPGSRQCDECKAKVPAEIEEILKDAMKLIHDTLVENFTVMSISRSTYPILSKKDV